MRSEMSTERKIVLFCDAKWESAEKVDNWQAWQEMSNEMMMIFMYVSRFYNFLSIIPQFLS